MTDQEITYEEGYLSTLQAIKPVIKVSSLSEIESILHEILALKSF